MNNCGSAFLGFADLPISLEILPLKGMMMIENVLEDLREAKPGRSSQAICRCDIQHTHP